MDSDRIPNLARCPRCFEVIDAASATCRFCNSALDPMQMKSAAASFRASVEAKSKINDSRSMRAGIIGLIAIVAPCIPGNRMLTCLKPPESPAHIDIS